MPSYYNPNNFYPASYPAGQVSFAPYGQQMQQSFAPQGPKCAMMWISDEMEARGQQIPQGYTQLAMWDTNNPVIYLKSLNQMGMPNPIQVLHYTIEEAKGALPAGEANGGNSGAAGTQMPDLSQYVTKQDLEEMKKELRNMMNTSNGGNAGINQNGNNSQQNRGGNRNG